MKLKLEYIKDVNFFMENRKLILNDVNSISEVTISIKLLNMVVNDIETLIDEYKTEIENLRIALAVKSENLILKWFEQNIACNFDNKTEKEIKKECLKGVKKELSNLKSEKDLNSVDIFSYNFVHMLYDCYHLEPKEIIKKIESDLTEIEI